MEFRALSVNERYACGIKQKEEGIMSTCTRRAATVLLDRSPLEFHVIGLVSTVVGEFRTRTMIRVKLPPSATVTRNYARVIIIFRRTVHSLFRDFVVAPISIPNDANFNIPEVDEKLQLHDKFNR